MMSSNYYVPNYVPIKDAYKIWCEKCVDDGIEPPTFEEFKSRRLL